MKVVGTEGKLSRRTVYKGFRMRSLSEARVARKLDALGVKWRYERYVVKTSLGWYCPDFYLPKLKLWIEVKGPEPKPWERRKCRDLALLRNEDVFLVWEDGTEALWFRAGGGKGEYCDGL